MFWKYLKFFILRALNLSFEKGHLPKTLRHCVISGLPKGNKPRKLLKNWRPISLLSVLYKIASSAITNRIKKVIDTIISRTQTGFIQNIFIGESTRLIYDIMQYTEDNGIDAQLMLIDFKKSF